MATKTYIRLLDDLDNSDADETIMFALDGAEYVIDLNQAHASELRDALSRFTKAARKTSGGRGRPDRKASGPNDAMAIRLWAINKGIQVNSRGRIQADIVEKYNAANH